MCVREDKVTFGHEPYDVVNSFKRDQGCREV